MAKRKDKELMPGDEFFLSIEDGNTDGSLMLDGHMFHDDRDDAVERITDMAGDNTDRLGGFVYRCVPVMAIQPLGDDE